MNVKGAVNPPRRLRKRLQSAADCRYIFFTRASFCQRKATMVRYIIGSLQIKNSKSCEVSGQRKKILGVMELATQKIAQNNASLYACGSRISMTSPPG